MDSLGFCSLLCLMGSKVVIYGDRGVGENFLAACDGIDISQFVVLCYFHVIIYFVLRELRIVWSGFRRIWNRPISNTDSQYHSEGADDSRSCYSSEL